MLPGEFKLIRLNDEHYFKHFDCGDGDLNEFLIEDSKNFLRSLLAVTYLLESDTHTVAFFSLFNDKITAEDFSSNRKWNQFRSSVISSEKRFKSYPAMKIGRLGICEEYKGLKIGTAILDFLKGWFVDYNRTGCKFITVDAYRESLGFYERNEFKFLTENDKEEDTRLMYFDLLPLHLN
jgi:hypothetical protein